MDKYCSIQFEQDIFQLINIYAPTKPLSRNYFYNKLQNSLENDKQVILAGEFNTTGNIFLDRLGGNPTNIHTIATQKLNQIKNKHKLLDIWRKTNTYKRHFTCGDVTNC